MRLSYFSVEAKQDVSLNSETKAQMKLGWFKYINEMNECSLFPKGFFSRQPNQDDLQDPMFPMSYDFFHPDGIEGNLYAEEIKYYVGSYLTSEFFATHKLSLGMDISYSELIDSWIKSNIHPVRGNVLQMQHYDGDESWMRIADAKRRITSITLQDEWKYSDSLIFTSGLRFDHYSDVGDSLTPRVAAVYLLSDEHILKIQYGAAFRPPTFYELYSQNVALHGNPEIEAETIHTVDAGYIFRNSDSVARITLFHSKIKDIIAPFKKGFIGT